MDFLFIVTLFVIGVTALMWWTTKLATHSSPLVLIAPTMGTLGFIPFIGPILALMSNPRDLFIYCAKKYAKYGVARISVFGLVNVQVVFGLPFIESFFKAPESSLSLDAAASQAVDSLLGFSDAEKERANKMAAAAAIHGNNRRRTIQQQQVDNNTESSQAEVGSTLNIEWIKDSITTSAKLESMAIKIHEEIDIWIDRLTTSASSSEITIDLFEEIYKLIVSINMRCFVSDDAVEYAEEMSRLLQVMENQGTTVQATLNSYSHARRETVAARKRVTEIVSLVRDKRLKQIDEGTYQPATPADRDVLQTCIDAGQDEYEIATNLISIFFAAQTNTVSTTSWTLAYLAKNKEWQNKVLREIQQIMPNGMDTQDNLTNAKLRELTKLDACIKETVRRNALVLIFRKALKNFPVKGTKVVFNKGDYVILSPSIIHHDEEVFPEPHMWNPERFVAPGATLKYKRRFIQWGFFTHRCLGEHFANLVMRSAIVRLVTKFELSIDQVQELDYSKILGMPFCKDKMHLTLIPRIQLPSETMN